MRGKWRIKWIDSGREPRQAPDPRYPHGIAINLNLGAGPSCRFALPYPAQRCGYFAVECETCGRTAMITTAGRADDPRSLELKCRIH